ncbi:unnamed protein product, partial [Closterium sp. NIES-53]
DHFLSLDPTVLTVDLLEQHLLASETSVVAVGAARGTPRTPFFEGCSPSPLAPSYASAAAADIPGAEDVGAASASVKRRSIKGKGGRGGGGGSKGGGGVSSGGGGGSGGCGSGGSGGGSGGFGGGGGGSAGSGGSGGSGSGGSREFGDEAERPRWAELLRSGVAVFDLDYDYVLAAMYALSVSAEGDCYLCVPPDPGTEAAALGASESALPGTAPVEALHTFTLDSVLARSSTVLPCSAVPSSSLSGLHLPSFSTNLVSTAALQDAMVTTTTPGGQRVSICTCTRTGRHLATFTRRPGSSLYTLATEPREVAASAQVSASGQVAPPCSCRLLSHQTLLWHHRLGHPSLPRLRGMHSRLLVSGLPRSLPPLPPSPTSPCLQRAAPHSSSFPPTTAPLQNLHMDDLPVLRLHSDIGGEFSSDLLRDFCRGEGILQLFTLPDSPQQNGIAERRIGLVMELNLWPRVSLPETSPTLRWTGKVGDALVFRVWCSRAFVRDMSADKLSARDIPCVFLDFSPDAPGWQFYHPTSRHVFPSQYVKFDEPVPCYQLFPYRSAPPPLPPLFLAPGPHPVDPLPPQGPDPSGVSQVDPLPGTVHVEVAVDSGAGRGAASGGATSGGAASGGAEPGDAEPGGVEPEGAESEGAGSGGAEPAGVESGGAEPEGVEPGGAESGGAEPRAIGAGDSSAGDTGARGAGFPAGSGGIGGAAAAGPGGGTVRPRRTLFPCFSRFLPASALPAPSPYTAQTGGLTKCRELASRPASPVCTGRRFPRPRPPLVPGTHAMALRPSSVPLRVPLPPPPESSLPANPDPESDRTRAASPTVSLLLATVVTHPSFESTAASALVAELSVSAKPPSVGGECALGTDVLEDMQEDFECLAAAVPRFASMLLAPEGDPDAPDIPTPRSYAEAITGPYSSRWQAAMDAEMASWKSTGTYIDAVPPSWANIVDGMWIFRVKQPPGSPPAFKARYVARGFGQRLGVDYF